MEKKFICNLFAMFALVLYVGLAPLQIVSANTPVSESTAELAAPTWVASASYLALGDSLAAGMDHLGEIGDGYADFLADTMDAAGLLNSYNKAFAVPGYTTKDVLKDLEENATREDADGKTIRLHDAIANASLITISAGANDVLAHVKIDPTTFALTYDEEALQQEIQQVGINLMKIITAIHTINPDAQVYLMGYYNPYPHLPEEIQPLLTQLLAGVNKAIETAAQLPNVDWVETADVVAKDVKSNLPNPQNIHLSPEGYQVVAEQFWNKVQADYPWIPVDAFVADEVTTDSVTLVWKAATTEGQIETYDIYLGEEKIGSVEGDVFTFTIGELEEGQSYAFFIVAVDENGTSSEESPSVTVKTEAIEPLFTDIKGHWAEKAIGQAASLGIFNGYTDGSFKPDNGLTRAQAASVFVRALNLPAANVAAPFNDIGDYAAETQADIQTAFAHGFIKGDNGHFKPTENVTRAQFALMVWRVATAELGGDMPTSNTFTAPADMGDYDAETVQAIATMSGLGFISLEDGAFHPTEPATRAFAASLLTKLLSVTNQ
ncbi:S-layer homology domain-containing protein [Sporosarcina sp. ACRSL]|uniref:S-layer homology domain-containing protein n=1 Tax=Sporosarcina sp. ACRSL TaxID=2918215 RepID=UPI001EF6989E|nr:S-layer homology domain-containing protein [Sporosarcina sp. ACRSL]MCG7343344.1 S-layer homology domain-containing protein [Sporosarcina sp. ACRSL]